VVLDNSKLYSFPAVPALVINEIAWPEATLDERIVSASVLTATLLIINPDDEAVIVGVPPQVSPVSSSSVKSMRPVRISFTSFTGISRLV